MEGFTAFLRLEIHDDAALVAVDTQIVRALPVGEGRTPAARFVPFGRFDFDHVCAKIAENHRTIGTSQHAAEVEHADSVQGLHNSPVECCCEPFAGEAISWQIRETYTERTSFLRFGASTLATPPLSAVMDPI